MRVAFVDFVGLDYTPQTPLERPLGGTESAACYLTTALAAHGHRIALINGTRTPGVFRGVECIGLQHAFSSRYLNTFDVIVVIACGSQRLREIALTPPIVLWTGYDVDQPLIQSLGEGVERFLWDKIVLVSDWQAERYKRSFRIGSEQIAVLRNAVGPSFESASRTRPYFFEDGRSPVLYYSSAPFRGLQILLRAFPLIRTLVPGCAARIYSGMAVYQASAFDDPYRNLYMQCRSTDGMEYLGPLGQSALAEAANTADVFAYPSTFEETSCIALMEAMASGCMVLSESLGAVPETASEFGFLHRRSAHATGDEFAESYARFVVQIIQEAYQKPDLHAARLDQQRSFALQNYSWSQRAVEWEGLLQAIVQRGSQAKAPRRNQPCPCGSGRKFKHCCGATAA